MTVAQIVCSVLWLGVGVNKSDPVIAVPNGIGLCLSIFTAALFAILPIDVEGAQLSSMTVAARTKARGKGGRDAVIAFMPVVNPAYGDVDLQDLDALLEGESVRLGNGDGGSSDDGDVNDGDLFDDDFLASLEDEELEEDSLIG